MDVPQYPRKSVFISAVGWLALICQTQMWGISAYEATFHQHLVGGALPGLAWIVSFPLAAVWLLGTIVYRWRLRGAQMLAVSLARAMAGQAVGTAANPSGKPDHLPAPVALCPVCKGKRVIGKRTSSIDPERPCPSCCRASGG